MAKAAEFRQKADEYEALAVQTKAGDLRQHYEAMAHEYRTLAEATKSSSLKNQSSPSWN